MTSLGANLNGAGRRRRANAQLRRVGGGDHPRFAGVERVLVAAVVLLAPINYFRLNAIYLTASDVVAVAALVVIAARRALPLAFFGPATGIWLVSFLAFAGGLSISSVMHGDPAALATELGQYGFSLLILPLVIAGRSYEQTLELIKLFIVSVVFVMVFGIYVINFVGHPDTHLVSGSGRLRSLVERENGLAALGALAMVFALGLNLLGELRRGWVVLGIPILFYGVLLTGSVSGLLTSALGLALVLLTCGTRRQILVAFAAVVVALTAISLSHDALLPQVFRDRVLDPLSNSGLAAAGTFVDRTALIKEALWVSRHTLLVGLGAGQYQQISLFNAPVHNVFLLAFVEGGLVAMLGLFGLFLSGMYLVWLAARQAAARKFAALTLIALLVFFFVFNMFPSFYARFWNVPLILALSLSVSLLPSASTKAARRPGQWVFSNTRE